MLSDEDKARIEAEETAKLNAVRALEAEDARIKALEVYRESVKSALATSPRRSKLPWIILGILALTVIGYVVLNNLPQADDDLSDNAGGISSRALVDRCKEDVQNKLGDFAAEFPAVAEIETQISSSSDGKRWDGWVAEATRDANEGIQFSCQYTPATAQFTVELIKP
jgi:hypothetical protein